MTLTEKRSIKVNNPAIFKKLDEMSFAAKNLRNAANYIISQCSRIHYKLENGEIIYSWEKALIKKVNQGIYEYNKLGHNLKYIDNQNGFIVDAYFLSFFMKGTKEYKALYSTSAQIIIQELCKDWKAFYKSMKAYKKDPSNFLGRPRHPGYLDPEKGRYWFTFTYQSIKINIKSISLPKSLDLDMVKITTSKDNIKQVKIKTEGNKIIANIIYKTEDIPAKKDNGRYFAIDPGVNNLMAIVSNTELKPFIINGRPLKSINQYYNKKKAALQSLSEDGKPTKEQIKLSQKRNNKVNDYMHKASAYLIKKAIENNINTIIFGHNVGWKQEADMDKKNNQNFVSIPFNRLIQMIEYKAAMNGINFIVIEEKYTSGTSYIDEEPPVKSFYDKKRRVKRGLFRSNKGIFVNADVNGAYQIMKKANVAVSYKGFEKVAKIKVA